MLATLLVMQIVVSTDIRDGAERTRGFETDSYLQGQEYATLLSILYVGYILMQIPSSVHPLWDIYDSTTYAW